MFPLRQRKVGGYSFGQPTFYGVKHAGTDYTANYEPLYAAFNGNVTSGFTKGGGNFITLIRPNGDALTSRHLSKVLKTGAVKAGEQVAVTGNTGAYTSGPHLHQEVKINGKLTDPEKYNWNPMPHIPITVVANKNTWTTLPEQLATLKEWFNHYSGQISVDFDIVHSDFADVPKMNWNNTAQVVDVGWYRQYVTPLGTGKATILLLNPEQWGINGTWGTMTYGDPGKSVRMEVMAQEAELNGPEGRYDHTNVFVHRAFHEICHMLFFLTGQEDRTHEFLLVAEDKKKELLDLVDLTKLQDDLDKIASQEKIKIRFVGWTDTEKGIYFPFDSLDRMKRVLDKLETDFPDYTFDNKEINLGKRPF